MKLYISRVLQVLGKLHSDSKTEFKLVLFNCQPQITMPEVSVQASGSQRKPGFTALL